MDKLKFQDLIGLCQLNIDKKHVSDCINVIKNEECLFEPGVILPQDKIASLYALRLEIAKEKGKHSSEYLIDFENSVSQLENSKSEYLGIATIGGEENSFFIFYEPKTNIILGILKPDKSLNLELVEHNETNIVNRGYSSSKQKYFKEIFVRDWK